MIWGPLGFWARPAHPAGRRAAGGWRAVAPTLTPLVSTHPPKIAIPLLGGMIVGPLGEGERRGGRAPLGPHQEPLGPHSPPNPILLPIPYSPLAGGQQSWVGGWTPVGSELARPTARPPPARPGVLAGPGTPRDPNHIFWPPNGSPSHHLGHRDRGSEQNSGPEVAVGVPLPEFQLC